MSLELNKKNQNQRNMIKFQLLSLCKRNQVDFLANNMAVLDKLVECVNKYLATTKSSNAR